MDKKPVISIIVRTIGRSDSLKKALDSVTAQTYTHLQLVIVNDSDVNLDWVKAYEIGSVISLKLVQNDGQHGRSIAANIGLENASGDFILFLDDDDWIGARHIEKLFDALLANTQAILAYTGCMLVDKNMQELGHFEFDLDKKQILMNNFMPIHSVLFRSEAKQKGCCFDETLDIYEDWDFWIQLSYLGDFSYTPNISAYYVIDHGNNSDAHIPEKASQGILTILKKWQSFWKEDDLLFLLKLALDSREESLKIKMLETQIQNLLLEKSYTQAQKETAQKELRAILQSKSWKLTQPLRWFVHKLHSFKQIKRKIHSKIQSYQRFFEKGSAFNGHILHKTIFKSHHGKRLCIFSHFDRYGIVDEYVLYYLQALKENECDIIFVSTAPQLNADELKKLDSLCSQIIVKENIGYDFGAWCTGLKESSELLEHYDELIICNDSVYAPLYELSSVFTKMENASYDAWSITDSHEVCYHMQSYFLVFNKAIMNNQQFWKFWDNYLVYKNKRNIIEKYEIGLSKFLMKCGYKIGAYCPSKEVTDKIINVTHEYWKELIIDHQCPTLKIELLRDNPLNVDLTDMKSIMSTTSYPFDLIENHLSRMGKKK